MVLVGGTAHLSGIVQKAHDFFCAAARLGRPRLSPHVNAVSDNTSMAAATGLLQEGLNRRRERQRSPQYRANVLARTVVRFGSWIRSTF